MDSRRAACEDVWMWESVQGEHMKGRDAHSFNLLSSTLFELRTEFLTIRGLVVIWCESRVLVVPRMSSVQAL